MTSKVDKLDTGKLETTPADLRKPCDAVKNDVDSMMNYNMWNDNNHFLTIQVFY